ncbi:MAG: glycosyltransferase [Candidatus Andersenbacteria bacterium]
MKIVFVTTQALTGSTVVGRVLPFAEEIAASHNVYVFAHEGDTQPPKGITVEYVGKDPFTRSSNGKRRLKGIALIARMIVNAWRTLLMLVHVQPDVAIIVKPLPQNVLATYVWRLFNTKRKVILDVDDFELTANSLSSVYQRAAIHWSERTGSRIASTIACATPFLQDHFRQLTTDAKQVELIPTPLPIQVSPISNTPSRPTLLYIGSVSITSGHRVDLLPEILEQVRRDIPEATLTIAGSGDDVASLEQLFAERRLQDAVQWTGRFSPQDVGDLLQTASVVLDPIDGSIVNRAKSSFRVAASAASGVPVVTSNIGIRPLLLPQKLHERFFAEPGSAAAYATRVIDLLKHPLSDEDRSNMVDHSKDHSTEKLSEAYEKLLT